MSLSSLEDDRRQYQEQLDIVLVSLKENAENSELLELKRELDQAIQLIDDSIDELKPKKAPPRPAPESASSPPPPPLEEKWSRDRKAAPAEDSRDKDQDPAAVLYNVNDTVLAKWVSGDKGFYPARITSVTGSSSAPIYTVKFKSYDTVETLRARDVRPVTAQKRKADGTPVSGGVGGAPSSHMAPPAPAQPSTAAAPPAGASSNPGHVLSAAATIYPHAQKGAAAAAGTPDQDPSEEGPAKKFKKIKAKKELEAGKSKWQDFNNKSKFAKTSHKKDSMFRTPEGIHGRVGFTGSGQAMRKDPSRSRHVYQANEDID